jgi:hypothetical protein
MEADTKHPLLLNLPGNDHAALKVRGNENGRSVTAEIVAAVRLYLALPRVRVARGGYRGDLGRITGPGAAGGYTVKTDSGVILYLAERDIERLD